MPPRRAHALLILAAVCVPLPAQWIHYPTPGVPRTAAGTPNLAAEAPRTADGKPDLSGMWLTAGRRLPCPALLVADDGSCGERTPIAADELIGIGNSVPGGLPYQPWARELAQKRAASHGRDDPHVRCLPANFPRAWGLPHIQKLIQNPGLLVILDEFNASYRQIFTDGRPLLVDPQPSWQGYSIGHWEGDTLVVETTGFRDDLWLDGTGTPLTDAAKITEHIRRPNFGTLEVDVTVDDAKAYTKAWTVHLKQGIVLDTELIDEICLENEQSLQHLPGK